MSEKANDSDTPCIDCLVQFEARWSWIHHEQDILVPAVSLSLNSRYPSLDTEISNFKFLAFRQGTGFGL